MYDKKKINYRNNCRIKLPTCSKWLKIMTDLMGYSVLVDNEEQAEKLQEIAIEQGFEWRFGGKVINVLDGRSFQFGLNGEKVITWDPSGEHYQDNFITKKAHFNDLFNSLEQCNMKLTKEQVYVNLQGKSEEELTDLYWLLKNNNQDLFHNDLPTFIEEYYKTNRFLEFYCGKWGGGSNLKTEVTIEQLKEILQPMETFTPIAMKCTQEQFDSIMPKLKGCKIGSMDNFEEMPYLINYRNSEKNSITNYLREDKSVNGMVVHEEWNEELFLKACGIEDCTLEQQLEKAKAEVKRLEKEIENNKIKFGDWVTHNNYVFKAIQDKYDLHILNKRNDFKKITNPQLIELLEQEIK